MRTFLSLKKSLLVLAILLGAAPAPAAPAAETPWTRHTIDDSSRGADGVRLADANGDGLPDIVTGWEQGGVTRLYLNPGPAKAREKWPAVTVGRTPNVEDAVLVDLDGDGSLDVVTCMEGKTRRMDVHWGPKDKSKILDPSAWKSEKLPAAADQMMWMYCTPMDVDGKNGIDLVAGGKNKGAKVGWFESPANPRDLAAWKFHPLTDCGWVMSIVPADMDGDGNIDLLISDRHGDKQGCRWLQNPGKVGPLDQPWKSHPVGPVQTVLFLIYADVDKDGQADVICGADRKIMFHRRLDGSGMKWETHEIEMPPNTGGFKAVSVADVDGDGRNDLVVTCEHADKGKHGVFWLSYSKSPTEAMWMYHPISGADGVKHDLCPLLDLDGDGDLDVLTTEEVKGLGVVWYENPARRPEK
jgi:hypothetical protein